MSKIWVWSQSLEVSPSLRFCTRVLATSGKSTFEEKKRQQTSLNSYSARLSAAQSEILNSSHNYFLPSRVYHTMNRTRKIIFS